MDFVALIVLFCLMTRKVYVYIFKFIYSHNLQIIILQTLLTNYLFKGTVKYTSVIGRLIGIDVQVKRVKTLLL